MIFGIFSLHNLISKAEAILRQLSLTASDQDVLHIMLLLRHDEATDSLGLNV